MEISQAQWDALAAEQDRGFRQRLVDFLAEHFDGDGEGAKGNGFKSHLQVATAACDFAERYGVWTELHVARLAIVLVVVDRAGLSVEDVRRLRQVLGEAGPLDERLDAAAAFVGIPG